MDAENPRAVMGGNAPPDPLLVEAAERIDTANRWLIERPDWKLWDGEMADKANFFISQITATWKALDERRKDENRKWLKKQDAVYKDPLALLLMASGKLAPLKTAWLKREEDRLEEQRKKIAEEAAAKQRAFEEAARAAEEAATKKGGDMLRSALDAQKAADAADAAAAAVEAVPERAQIKGSYSGKATSLKDYWSAEITDLTEAFKFFNKKGNPHKARLTAVIQAAIQSIADGEARLHKDKTKAPPGIEFKVDRR